MNIFEALLEDHDIQRSLLDKLVRTSGDSKQRDVIFKALKYELQIHADAEERHFYIALIDRDKTQEKARHCIAKHHEIDERIAELEKTEYASSASLKIAKNLKHKVAHHLEEEEHAIFQLAGKVLSEKLKKSLAKEYVMFLNEHR